MRVYFHTFGCRLNFSETEIIIGSLTKRGNKIVDSAEIADLCVINTCTVTERSDMKCRQFIRSIQKKNPNAKIAVIGCYSQISGEEIAEIGGVHLILGTQEKMNLANYISQLEYSEEPIISTGSISHKSFTIDHTEQRTRTRANLKIQDGCDFYCSFCIIPFSRGRSRAREYLDIMNEAGKLAKSGYKEIVLTGVNIGTYQYFDYQITDVIRGLDEIDGIERIRISSIEPTTVPDEVLTLMADPSSKLVPYLHLPLQSASNPVLKDMRRKYSIEEYIQFLDKALETVENICIGTDILTGFPTESDALFENTYLTLEKLPIHYFHVFPYSERENTRSARMAEKNARNIINHRSSLLRRLSEKKREAYYQSHIGKILPVLFEDKDSQNGWKGYTPNYIRVACHSENELKGEIINCKIQAVNETHVEAHLLQTVMA